MLQLSQRPLTASTLDVALFVGRETELAQLDRATRHGFNTLILGARGSGRTSLLHRFAAQQRDEVAVTYVDGSAADTVEELVDSLHLAIHGRPVQPETRALLAIQGFDSFASRIRALNPPGKIRTIVQVDGIQDPDVVAGLFGGQRDELWELPYTWIVTGTGDARARYLRPPADAFFDVEITLDELGLAEATELLQRRADAAGDEPDAEVMMDLAGQLVQVDQERTPRNVLASARRAIVDGTTDGTRSLAETAAAQTRASRLGRPAAMLYTELLELGPVSASDSRLLERIGWTRSRASQVLSELEAVGLVVATEERSGSPGRPRRAYRAVTSTDASDR